jgi:hypothetical protein
LLKKKKKKKKRRERKEKEKGSSHKLFSKWFKIDHNRDQNKDQTTKIGPKCPLPNMQIA